MPEVRGAIATLFDSGVCINRDVICWTRTGRIKSLHLEVTTSTSFVAFVVGGIFQVQTSDIGQSYHVKKRGLVRDQIDPETVLRMTDDGVAD